MVLHEARSSDAGLTSLRANTFAGVGRSPVSLAEAKPRCPSLQTNPLYRDITSSPGAVFLRMRYLRL
jgi:hypothetical protein